MKLIPLRGKYAVGTNAHAMVDDDVYEAIGQHKWKAKPNGSGNNVYAVRVEKGVDGVSRDVRMHREVMAYRGDLDIDHIDHNALNNQRANLRVVTRSDNVLNARRLVHKLICAHCGVAADRVVSSTVRSPVLYCSPKCNDAAQAAKATATHAPRSSVAFGTCRECGLRFTSARMTAAYCSASCKQKFKRDVMRSDGRLADQLAKSRERCKRWRAAKRA